MTTLGVPVERIGQRARRARPGFVLLTFIAALFFGTGWIAAKALSALWLGVVWSAIAVAEGWREGRKAAGNRNAPRHQ